MEYLRDIANRDAAARDATKKEYKMEHSINKDSHKLIYNGYGILNGRFFSEEMNLKQWNISEKEASILAAGPENIAYSATWQEIIDTRTWTDEGITYSLEEDKDYNLYLVVGN